MSKRLAALLSPFSPSEFMRSFEVREYLFVPRNLPGYYNETVGINDLDAYLRSGVLPRKLLRVVTDGVAPPADSWSRSRRLASGTMEACLPERVFQLFAGGATLILEAIHEAIPAVSELCRELARELGYPVQANAYITPPSARGFLRHCDEHDVMILQLHGRKLWSVYPSDQGAKVDLELNDGDLLYIPRGMGHEASCSINGSVHVTIGLYPTYMFQLVEELAKAARGNPLFQRPVPAADPEALRQLEAELVRGFQTLVSELPPRALVANRFRDFVDGQAAGWNGWLRDLLRMAEMRPETVLRARSCIARRVEQCPDGFELHFAGVRIVVPRFLKPTLDRILTDTEFAVQDLPGFMTTAGKMEFVRPFVLKGFLEIVRV